MKLRTMNTKQKSAALNWKKHALHVFIHKSRSFLTASLLCTALLFPYCANVKGIFTDDNSTASATPPPDLSQCEAEAEEGGLSFAGGDGTEDTPFEVSSPEQLANIGQILYCNFRLTQNITLSGNWTPLGAESPCDGGNDDACFQGALDGNDFMISDLTVNITGNYGGLFGYTGEHSEIRSVGLSGLSVRAGAQAGGLVGENNGSISNSYATGAVSGSNNRIGGLVGRNDGTINNSYTTDMVSGVNSVGGLVGRNDGTINNSYTTDMVSGVSFVGGLVGRNDGTISNSYAAGTVSGTSGIGIGAGGLVGSHEAGNISNSYAAGTISPGGFNENEGGLAGENSFGSSDISGINYFADDVGGSDGIGGGASCDDVAVCKQAAGGSDAARATWLEDSLDETDDDGLNWDAELDADGNAVWGNLDAAGFPCLKNMPTGAPSC